LALSHGQLAGIRFAYPDQCFVGDMVGIERTIMPLIGAEESASL
jgi:hypothetical protein